MREMSYETGTPSESDEMARGTGLRGARHRCRMGKVNVMAVSWQTPVHTSESCMVLLVLNPKRYTYELIRQNHELVINVLGESLFEQTHLVGTVSGRKVNEFNPTGLTPVPASRVQLPLIAECARHLECRIAKMFTVSTHDLVLCEVVHASAEEEFFDGVGTAEKFHTPRYMQATQYELCDRRTYGGSCVDRWLSRGMAVPERPPPGLDEGAFGRPA
jgi:flavin reductase (DIM6/NTAB) family NADH-FMN oxidoreductase RutF